MPDDPRITVLPYEEVPRDDYDRRLATIDVLALPLEGGTYLTTGQVADAVGAGLPGLVSPWPYLPEALGDAAIPYGRTAADLAATIDALDDATLDRARAAAVARRADLDWAVLAEDTYDAARRGRRRPPALTMCPAGPRHARVRAGDDEGDEPCDVGPRCWWR